MLDVKKLLTKMLQRIGGTNVYVSASNGITGGLRLFKDYSTNSVRGYGYFRRSTDIAASTTIFVIPDGYRPSSTWEVPMMLTTNSNYTAGYYGAITSAGAVTQSLGNTIREGFMAFEYSL